MYIEENGERLFCFNIIKGIRVPRHVSRNWRGFDPCSTKILRCPESVWKSSEGSYSNRCRERDAWCIDRAPPRRSSTASPWCGCPSPHQANTHSTEGVPRGPSVCCCLPPFIQYNTPQPTTTFYTPCPFTHNTQIPFITYFIYDDFFCANLILPSTSLLQHAPLLLLLARGREGGGRGIGGGEKMWRE